MLPKATLSQILDVLAGTSDSWLLIFCPGKKFFLIPFEMEAWSC